jgi:hypothetical protein
LWTSRQFLGHRFLVEHQYVFANVLIQTGLSGVRVQLWWKKFYFKTIISNFNYKSCKIQNPGKDSMETAFSSDDQTFAEIDEPIFNEIIESDVKNSELPVLDHIYLGQQKEGIWVSAPGHLLNLLMTWKA